MHAMIATLLVSLSLQARMSTGPGNGTDAVKVIFQSAQDQLQDSFSSHDLDQLVKKGIKAEHQRWLLHSIDGKTRWQWMQRLIFQIELNFQYEGCTDASKLPASICFFGERSHQPRVVVSLDLNRQTDLATAKAMLIHEMGHYLAESDHLLLDQLGIDVVKRLASPKVITAQAEKKETVSSVFIADQNCEAGQGQQAMQVREEIVFKINAQCAQLEMSCDLNHIQFIFEGEPIFLPGIGFTQDFVCRGMGQILLDVP